MNNAWLIPAIACMIAWGFSRFFPKLAVGHLDPKSAFVYEIAGELIMGIAILASIGFKPDFHAKGSLLAMMAGITGALGVYFYLVAAQRGNVSQLVFISALYPIVTVALGVLLLSEPLTWKEWLAMALAMSAILLIAS